MAQPLDPKQIVTTEEIVITNMVEISAVIELLMERCNKLRGKMRGA